MYSIAYAEIKILFCVTGGGAGSIIVATQYVLRQNFVQRLFNFF